MYAVLCRYIKFTFYWLSFTMDKRATKRKRVVLKIEDKLAQMVGAFTQPGP